MIAARDSDFIVETLRNRGNLRAGESTQWDIISQIINGGDLRTPSVELMGAAALYNRGTIIAGSKWRSKFYLPAAGLDNDGGSFKWIGDLDRGPVSLHFGGNVFEVIRSGP